MVFKTSDSSLILPIFPLYSPYYPRRKDVWETHIHRPSIGNCCGDIGKPERTQKSMKSATNPSSEITLTFDPQRHVYRDCDGYRYVSGTAFVKRYFKPFDAITAAERVSARTGQSPLEIIAAWKAKGEASSTFGTLVHAYAEAKVIGAPGPDAPTPEAAQAYRLVDAALSGLEKTYEFIGAEMIVYDPVYRLAGDD
jgi:hypothetical protein